MADLDIKQKHSKRRSDSISAHTHALKQRKGMVGWTTKTGGMNNKNWWDEQNKN